MPDTITLDLDGLTLELQHGDISDQPDVDAVVNAANAQLQPGGGVAGAIHSSAGPELAEACAPHAPIEVAEAVVTDAFNLPNARVVHVLGPVHGEDTPSDKLLAGSYANALRAADADGLTSVAFPSLSTGAFGYPMDEAATIALETVRDRAGELENLDLVRFVLYSEDAFATFRDAATALG